MMMPLEVSGEFQETITDDALSPSTCKLNGASSGAVTEEQNN